MTAELIADLIKQMETDLGGDVFLYCDDDGDGVYDHANAVNGYLRQLKMILKVELSKPIIAQPIGQIGPGSFDVCGERRTKQQVLEQRKSSVMGGCCERFADNKACDCLEKAV